MNLNEIDKIKALIQQGESRKLEFKKSTAGLKSACETACAFLNSDGGIVLIGVADDGHICGQQVTETTKRKIGHEIAKITPSSETDVKVHYVKLPDENKYIIVLEITTDSMKRPYMYANRAFLRIESSTSLMSRDYLRQLTLMNAEGKFSWECQTPSDISIDDLDIQEILSTLKEGTMNGRIPTGYLTEDPWLALERLRLIEKGKITNAALILFGKEPEKKYPQCLLQLARFKGKDKSEFIENKQITGNIFKLLESALIFANNYLPIKSTFQRGEVKRQDNPLFPIVVLREAIANALCHRDYSRYDGSISFAIYDDRLEIWNSGLLPLGVSAENLVKLNRSIPKNRKIANVLYYHGIFESWGRGVQMIINECKKAGHPAPFYSQDPIGTLLTLPSKQLIGVASSPTSSTQISFDSLSKRQQEIVTLLREHQSLSPGELRRLMKSSPAPRTLRDEMNRLRKLKVIDFSGQTRSRKWFTLI